MKYLLPSLTALFAMSPAFAAVAVHNDFDGDGRSDLLWHNVDTGANVIWRNGVASNSMGFQGLANPDWQIAGSGDFDGDHRADILWRNRASGAMEIWYAGSAARTEPVRFDWADSFDNPEWEVAAIGDFDGDQQSDLLWRNRITGGNAVGFVVRNGWESTFWYAWRSNAAVKLTWKIAGSGDFDGDGRSEVLWRNTVTGANAMWHLVDINSYTAFGATRLTGADPAWSVAGIGDFNGDSHSDVLWRNRATGANRIWWSANPTTRLALAAATPAWIPASIADINGDQHADIVWRNTVTGANAAWLSANSASASRLTAVTNQAWKIVP